jgi:hypothetical protein
MSAQHSELASVVQQLTTCCSEQLSSGAVQFCTPVFATSRGWHSTNLIEALDAFSFEGFNKAVNRAGVDSMLSALTVHPRAHYIEWVHHCSHKQPASVCNVCVHVCMQVVHVCRLYCNVHSSGAGAKRATMT